MEAFLMSDFQTFNREYKDTLFRWIFGRMDEKSKIWRLELYNALNNSDYKAPDELELTTIENVIYISMKNDLSFLIDSKMNLYEQQSTYNPNMPLRGLMYFSQLYEIWLANQEKDLFGSKIVKIPTPQFVVFYNGDVTVAETQKLRLSDAFMIQDKSGDFEWTATMININDGYNKVLNKKCKSLYDYNRYISRIKTNIKSGLPRNEAISESVEWAIKENLLDGFFKTQKAEVTKMLLTEFNKELYEKNRYQEGLEDGSQQKAIEAAKNLIKMKIGSLDQIAQAEGLSLEIVKQLADELQ